jgi:hypothetical protein
MARKLPVAGPPPSLDAVRRRLGGRAATDAGAGDLVRVELAGTEKVGVVLFALGDEVQVWLDTGLPRGLVKRTRRELTLPHEGPPPSELASVADDARVFGSLREGERVRYQPAPGTFGEGTLVEKCRFGGLLVRDDGVVVGVGFRRLWPAGEPPTSAAN